MFARSFTAAAALALATVSAGAAQAQRFETESVLVHFGDLDLGSAKDMMRLDMRLKSAARSVCDSGGRDIHSLRADAECRARALSGARTELAALTRSRGGGRTEVALRR